MEKFLCKSDQFTELLFQKQQKDVVAFRILVYSGTGGGQGLASCAEMEFYRDASYDKDYLKLFTDASCSQLRKTLKNGDS